MEEKSISHKITYDGIEVFIDFIHIIRQMSDEEAGKAIICLLKDGIHSKVLREIIKKYSQQYSEFDIPCFSGPPYSPGVYGIFEVDDLGIQKVIYIGSSKNIRKRLFNSNHHYLKEFGKRKIITRSIICSNYLELEKNLILKYKPELNINGK